MWALNRNRQALGVLAAACGLSGCVSHDPYPDYWPPVTAVPAAACADIAGRYRDEAIHTGRCYSGGDGYKAQWECDLRLSWALGQPAIAADEQWVEIRQPEADRIVIVTSGETRVLKRSAGDFDCDDQGVRFSQHASTFSKQDESKAANATLTAMELLFASGGVNSLSLHFSKAADGSLIAKLSESSSGLVLAIPYHRSSQHYLRWATLPDEAQGRRAVH